MLLNNKSDLRLNFASWSYPTKKDNYVYYVYGSLIEGDEDKVYRFTITEHELLLKLYKHDDVRGIDHSWIIDNCIPYIVVK